MSINPSGEKAFDGPLPPLEVLQLENENLSARLAALKAQKAQKDAPAPVAVLHMPGAAAAEAKEDAGKMEAEIAHLFLHYDQDGSGFIDEGEFAFLAFDLGAPLTEAEVSSAVKDIDTSGDGKISLAEFTAWFKAATESGATKKSSTQWAIVATKLKLKAFGRKVGGLSAAAEKASALVVKGGADDWVKDNWRFALGPVPQGDSNFKVQLACNPITPAEASARAASLGSAAPLVIFFDVNVNPGKEAKAEEFIAIVTSIIAALEPAMGPPPFKFAVVRHADGSAVVRATISAIDDDPVAQVLGNLVLAEVLKTYTMTLEGPHAVSHLSEAGATLMDYLAAMQLSINTNWSHGLAKFASDLLERVPHAVLGDELTVPLTTVASTARFLNGYNVDVVLAGIKAFFASLQLTEQDQHDDDMETFFDMLQTFKMEGGEAVKLLKEKLAEIYVFSGYGFKNEFTNGNGPLGLLAGLPNVDADFVFKAFSFVQECISDVKGFEILSVATGLHVEGSLRGVDFFKLMPSVAEIQDIITAQKANNTCQFPDDLLAMANLQ